MVQIAVLEEQKKEATEIEEDDKVEVEVEDEASAVEPSEEKIEEKPDMNDVPMEDNQVKLSVSNSFISPPKLKSSP